MTVVQVGQQSAPRVARTGRRIVSWLVLIAASAGAAVTASASAQVAIGVGAGIGYPSFRSYPGWAVYPYVGAAIGYGYYRSYPGWAVNPYFGGSFLLYPQPPLMFWPVAPLAPYLHRHPDGLACYRYGRCSVADIRAHWDRLDRLDRLAPTAEAPSPPPDLNSWRIHPQPITPTPEENIRPEHRGASLPREEFSGSGHAR